MAVLAGGTSATSRKRLEAWRIRRFRCTMSQRGSHESGIGDAMMRKSWLYSGVLPVSLLLATGGTAVAQDHAHDVAAPAQITRTVMWSDASAWPSDKVPAAGASRA